MLPDLLDLVSKFALKYDLLKVGEQNSSAGKYTIYVYRNSTEAVLRDVI